MKTKKSKLEKSTRKFHDDADLYDAINNFDHDVKFYKKWCKKAGRSVLELCCGTGRIAIPLIQAGLDYTGIDLSHPFLIKANKKAQAIKGDYLFKLEDIRTFSFKKKFDCIFIAFNSMAHLYTYQDVEKCFKQVKKHLSSNGFFIISIFNPNPKFFLRNPKERYDVLGEVGVTEKGRKFTVSESNYYDKATQINHIKWYYQFEDCKEEIVRDLTMRMFYPEELLALLHYNGFEVVKRFGDFNEGKFKSDSVMQNLIVRKKSVGGKR